MGVKTALPKSRKSTKTTNTRTKPKTQARTSGGQFGSGSTTGRKRTAAQMNKGMAGASKPPKGVNKPAGGTKAGRKPAGGKRGC
jgi:hypothetical protein